MNSKFLAFADVYAYKIMRCEISLGGGGIEIDLKTKT